METAQLIAILATAIATATPLVYAAIGETITEKAGVINLSAEGTIMLSAMVAFAIAQTTNNLFLGFAGAAAMGALIALIVAFSTITLKQSQIAIGFVLALLCSDLSTFLGNPFVRIPGPTVPSWRIPLLQDIPILGPLLFRSDLLVYSSFALIFLSWFFFYRTRNGLLLRAIGEQPAAAFARGANVIFLRYFYTLFGGALMGIAGAAFSLDFKAGWSYRHTAGYGWIALAIVIFGGWNPLKVALGAYLFGILQSLASLAQSTIPQIPTQVFSVAPFVLMILVLALTGGDWIDRLLAPLPLSWRRPLAQALQATPPASLGKAFEQD
ncbi:ABC transporter permease [Desertifilum sp. FACHB-1129]|uniref:Amino acid ABC transporter permease n=1 Tax=Desertifilum tharense IPPAS B-1220 TaxID=1781255 RepID=A0A1E5QNL4_9CYAN|nr:MULTISPECIES: ABC transporter permease [Desertifilum]MDA0212234.1 ABC transporter permease [Cyanobacteria bacterium FC1]MBD2312813.1 ABC transporter permease [Desertifilum sp. FACHB-1129]MBD2324177.1 ABC transporter permease [Desertifilum sp. FACHB-866]MBD2334191.1 ABC transporter permease [Desertifilum sp. FACHB-868]OEJ76255.1 amino acid ABC transporter permease [Desertifilum tharense IPPAS B-1220]